MTNPFVPYQSGLASHERFKRGLLDDKAQTAMTETSAQKRAFDSSHKIMCGELFRKVDRKRFIKI